MTPSRVIKKVQQAENSAGSKRMRSARTKGVTPPCLPKEKPSNRRAMEGEANPGRHGEHEDISTTI